MRDKMQERGECRIFDVKREKVGRIRLTEGIDLVIYKAGDHLDMRLGVNRLPYKGLSFFLPQGVYEELKELIGRVDEVYQKKPEQALTI